jgi:hypothetical protein
LPASNVIDGILSFIAFCSTLKLVVNLEPRRDPTAVNVHKDVELQGF